MPHSKIKVMVEDRRSWSWPRNSQNRSPGSVRWSTVTTPASAGGMAPARKASSSSETIRASAWLKIGPKSTSTLRAGGLATAVPPTTAKTSPWDLPQRALQQPVVGLIGQQAADDRPNLLIDGLLRSG